MRIPRNYDQVTIEEYQTIYSELQKEDIDWTFIICFFTKKSIDEVEAFDFKLRFYIIKQLSFLLKPIEPKNKSKYFASGLLKSIRLTPRPKKFLKLGGKIFKASKGVLDINTGRLREIKTTVANAETIKVLHELCALTYEENTKKWFGFNFKYIKNNRFENSQLFLKAPVSVGYQSVFFCSEVLQNWTLNTPDYLEGEKVIAQRVKEILEELQLSNTGTFGNGRLY